MKIDNMGENMKNRDRIFNTFGFSIEEILKMNKNNIEDVKLKEVYKEVTTWRFVEKIEYFEDLRELKNFLEKKKLDILSKEHKKKIIGEIMKYLNSENVRDGEEYLSALKKEVENGGLNIPTPTTLE
jgi:predicted DNA binding CopG/RHH family protein